MKIFIKPILLLIPLTFLQIVVVPLISFAGIAPNLIVILLIYYTLIHGQIFGTILGFIFGLTFDLVSGGLIGASMLSMTIAGFIAGYFYHENKIDFNTASFFFMVIVFLCGSIDSFIYSSVANSNPDVSFFNLIIELGLLPGMFTSALSVAVVIFIKRKVI